MTAPLIPFDSSKTNNLSPEERMFSTCAVYDAKSWISVLSYCFDLHGENVEDTANQLVGVLQQLIIEMGDFFAKQQSSTAQERYETVSKINNLLCRMAGLGRCHSPELLPSMLNVLLLQSQVSHPGMSQPGVQLVWLRFHENVPYRTLELGEWLSITIGLLRGSLPEVPASSLLAGVIFNRDIGLVEVVLEVEIVPALVTQLGLLSVSSETWLDETNFGSILYDSLTTLKRPKKAMDDLALERIMELVGRAIEKCIPNLKHDVISILLPNYESFRTCITLLLSRALSHSIDSRAILRVFGQTVSRTRASGTEQLFTRNVADLERQLELLERVESALKSSLSGPVIVLRAFVCDSVMSFECGEVRRAIGIVLHAVYILLTRRDADPFPTDTQVLNRLLALPISQMLSFALRRTWPADGVSFEISREELDEAMVSLSLPHGSSELLRAMASMIPFQNEMRVLSASLLTRAIYLASQAPEKTSDANLFAPREGFVFSLHSELDIFAYAAATSLRHIVPAETLTRQKASFINCAIEAAFELAFVMENGITPVDIKKGFRKIGRAFSHCDMRYASCERRQKRVQQEVFDAFKALNAKGLKTTRDERIAWIIITDLLTSYRSKVSIVDPVRVGYDCIGIFASMGNNTVAHLPVFIAFVLLNAERFRAAQVKEDGEARRAIKVSDYLAGTEWNVCLPDKSDVSHYFNFDLEYNEQNRIDVDDSLSFKFCAFDQEGSYRRILIMMSIDGGKSWTERSDFFAQWSSRKVLRAVLQRSEGNLTFYVTQGRRLYVSHDNLLTFKQVSTDAPLLQPDDIFMVTPKGHLLICWLRTTVAKSKASGNRIFRSSDGGLTWKVYKSNVFGGSGRHSDLSSATNSIACLGQNMYLILPDVGLAVSTSDGLSWRIMRCDLKFTNIIHDSYSNRILGFTSQGVYNMNRAGCWEMVGGPVSLRVEGVMQDLPFRVTCSSKGFITCVLKGHIGDSAVIAVKVSVPDESRRQEDMRFVTDSLSQVGFDPYLVSLHVVPFLFPSVQ